MVGWLRDNIVRHIRPLLRKLGLIRFWEHVVVPGLHAVKDLGLLGIFFLLAVVAAGGAFLLQRVAFPSAAGSSAERISATVYVERLPAQVILQSTFTPSAPTNNVSFAVRVTGPTKKPDPWLLIVQCKAPPSNKRYRTVPLISEGLAGNKQPVGRVLVKSESTHRPRNFKFTCLTGLTEQGQTAATVVQNQDLNLSLPVLEQNPFAQSGLADAPLYAEKVAGKYRDVVEVQALSSTPCPTPTPSPNTTSPLGGSPSPSAGTGSSSPAATSSPSSSVTTSATPSPTAAACYARYSAGATSVKYSFPAPTAGTTVATSEILNNVTLSDERIDSIFPPGTIMSSQVTWQGGVDLSPSLIATNLASAARQNKDAFWAGLLYGIAAALAIPYLVEFYREWRKEREDILKKESLQGNT
jgi:hypothetical protein